MEIVLEDEARIQDQLNPPPCDHSRHRTAVNARGQAFHECAGCPAFLGFTDWSPAMTPLDVARIQAGNRERAALEAALEALDATVQPDLLLVQPFEAMTPAQRKKHREKRHPRVSNDFLTHHNLSHRTDPGLDHYHEGTVL